MIYRRLTETGDYTLGHGSQDWVSDREAVAQACRTNLLLLRGEWWENLENGLPLFEEIIGTVGTDAGRASIDAIIVQRLTETEGVREVVDIVSTITGHHYAATATVDTIYGETQVEVSY